MSPRSGHCDGGRKKAIAKIHIAKQDFAMPNEAYRALLKRVTGKASCRDMTLTQLHQVLMRFKQLGWRSGKRADITTGRPAQRKKITALLHVMNKPQAYGDAIAQKQCGKPVMFCNATELRGVIAALEVSKNVTDNKTVRRARVSAV